MNIRLVVTNIENGSNQEIMYCSLDFIEAWKIVSSRKEIEVLIKVRDSKSWLTIDRFFDSIQSAEAFIEERLEGESM